MRKDSYAGVGHSSPYYPHLKRLYELRNEVHGALLWMKEDDALEKRVRRLLVQYIGIANSALADAYNEIRDRYQQERGLFQDQPTQKYTL